MNTARISSRTLAGAGLIIAIASLAGSPVCLAQATAEAPAPAAAKQKTTSTVALIEIEDGLAERSKTLGLSGQGTQTTLRDVLAAMRQIAEGNDHNALVIRLKDAALPSAHVEELSSAIKKIRASGKKVFLFAEGYSNTEFALGAACDQVLLQKGGEVMYAGMHMEEMFLADMFKWVGIKPDFVQVGDYKGASEQYNNSKPSPQWDANINALLDAMWNNHRAKVKAGRKLSDEQLDTAMKDTWMADGQKAIKAGLIDAVVDLPDLDKHIAGVLGTSEVEFDDSVLPDHEAKMEEMAANPFAMLKMFTTKPNTEPKRDTIAVVHVDGAIIDGESTEGGLMGGDGSVGSRTLRRALAEIEDNDKVKGVVIRIDSPGGSAIASEVIWQGVKRVSDKKPVWVSIGNMAASGGYYIAVSGQKIYVNPSSIVGSIGVVGGKMTLAGVYDKLHINTVSRSRGPRAGMFASNAPWTDEERTLVRQKMTETYELFTSRVTAGRPGIDLSKTAEGRLFVGSDAIGLKMADKVGGLTDAIGDMATSLSLADGKYDVLDYPAPKSFAETLENMFGGFGVTAPLKRGNASLPAGFTVGGGPVSEIVAVGKSIMGEQPFNQVASGLQALLQLRKEPVILVSPRVLIFK